MKHGMSLENISGETAYFIAKQYKTLNQIFSYDGFALQKVEKVIDCPKVRPF